MPTTGNHSMGHTIFHVQSVRQGDFASVSDLSLDIYSSGIVAMPNAPHWVRFTVRVRAFFRVLHDTSLSRCDLVRVYFPQIRQLQKVDETGQWRAYVLGLDDIGDVSATGVHLSSIKVAVLDGARSCCLTMIRKKDCRELHSYLRAELLVFFCRHNTHARRTGSPRRRMSLP